MLVYVHSPALMAMRYCTKLGQYSPHRTTSECKVVTPVTTSFNLSKYLHIHLHASVEPKSVLGQLLELGLQLFGGNESLLGKDCQSKRQS